MVPAGVPLAGRLPLTPNSKIDKKALTALAAELDVVDEDDEAPGHPDRAAAGRRVGDGAGRAGEQIGRRDHFFDRGGTSLSR